jgi:hypothetical protein
MEIGLVGLMHRFPNLRLAVPLMDIRLSSGEHQLYCVYELPVTW